MELLEIVFGYTCMGFGLAIVLGTLDTLYPKLQDYNYERRRRRNKNVEFKFKESDGETNDFQS